MKTEIQSLRNILAKLYSQKSSIRRVVDDTELNLERIDFDSAPIDIWHSILSEAEKVGRIEILFIVVEREYGSNQGLRNACTAYRQATGQLGPNYDQGDYSEAITQGREPLMNCDKEMIAFRAMLEGEEPHIRAIVLQGPHGCGKSRLLNECRRLALERERLVVYFDLKQRPEVEVCLERIARKLANYDKFPGFLQNLRSEKPDSESKQKEWRKQLTLAFFADLERLPLATKWFIFFDHFEEANNIFQYWFLEEFMKRVEDSELIVGIAGVSNLESVCALEWVRCFTPKVPSIEHFYQYAQICGVQVDPRFMKVLYSVFQSAPKGFVDCVEHFRLQQQGPLT